MVGRHRYHRFLDSCLHTESVAAAFILPTDAVLRALSALLYRHIVCLSHPAFVTFCLFHTLRLSHSVPVQESLRHTNGTAWSCTDQRLSVVAPC